MSCRSADLPWKPRPAPWGALAPEPVLVTYGSSPSCFPIRAASGFHHSQILWKCCSSRCFRGQRGCAPVPSPTVGVETGPALPCREDAPQHPNARRSPVPDITVIGEAESGRTRPDGFGKGGGGARPAGPRGARAGPRVTQVPAAVLRMPFRGMITESHTLPSLGGIKPKPSETIVLTRRDPRVTRSGSKSDRRTFEVWQVKINLVTDEAIQVSEKKSSVG